MFSVDGQRVVVVGAARSGVAAAELLASRGADEVVLTDLRTSLDEEARLREAGVRLELGGHRRNTFVDSDLIVLSPGVSPLQPDVAAARDADVPVIGELELAFRWLKGRVVAITGTKGKSTTTTLIGRMLEAGGVKTMVGGNIGVPLSAQVNQSTPDTIHVVEASSFQLEVTELFHPMVAVLLNFSPDHLDRHASVDEYAEAKARIFLNQSVQDWVVVSVDDPEAVRLASRSRARQIAISRTHALPEGLMVAGATAGAASSGTIVRRGARTGGASGTAGAAAGPGAGARAGAIEERALVPLSAVRLIGPHLVTDVLAAAAVADIFGVSPEAMTKAVAGFPGLEHALELVRDIDGVHFVNDSKATNVEAAERSIESFDRDLIVIMGGRYKGGEFRRLREPLRARQATVVAIGEARPLLHQALADAIPVRDSETMDDAVRLAFASAVPGGTVLLAPACSSFDMFRDYAERGKRFKEAVLALAVEMERTRRQ
jgi:UDP-N-acetylmuramoylalanine--D-glutamate ligase